MECRPPDSTVHGILQSGILEWVAISFSRASSQQSRDWTHVSTLQVDSLLTKPPRKPILYTYTQIHLYIYTHTHTYIYMNLGDIRDAGLFPKLGRSPGAGHNNPLWYSCLGNPIERRAICIICLSHYLPHQVLTCIPILLTLMVCLILFP